MYKRLKHSIENIIDIFSIIYSELKLGIPNNDDDILNGLNGVFPEKIIKLAKELRE